MTVVVLYMQYMPKSRSPAKRDLPVLPAGRAECACTSLRRAARQVTSLYDDALAPTGLRITQFSLLATVDRHGSVPMTDLATMLSMDRTTLTRNLTPLQRDGLVSLRLAGVGRTKLVAMTERGRRRLLEAFPYWDGAQKRFQEAVGDASVQLSKIANTIRRKLGER
jgi:DNA-binding MarR family transcriptional regulator